MMSRRPGHTEAAAILGLLALVVQSLIPFLLALEIRAASWDDATPAVRPTAPASYIHPSSDQGSPLIPCGPPAHGGHGGGLKAGCPICLALQASPAITVPATLDLPMPAMVGIALPEVTPRPNPSTPAPASYRSRAPPLA